MRNQMDWLLNSGWESASTTPIELRRVRTLTASAYLLLLLGVPYLLRAFQWQIEVRMVAIPCAMLLMMASILLLRFTKKLYPASHLAPLALYVAGAGAIYTGGGIGSIATGWGLVVPLLAGLLVSLRTGLMWGILILLSLALVHFLQQQGMPFLDLTPPDSRPSQVLVQCFGVTAAILILMSSYLSQLEQSEKTLARQNHDLKLHIQRAEQAEEDAQRAVLAKTRFLANMSHELRTPLNSVLGFSQRLNKHVSGRLQKREIDALNHILINGQRMMRLLDDLLDLSRIEAGSMTLSKSPLELQQALDRAWREVEPEALRAGSNVKLVFGNSVQVIADGQRIVQVLISILAHSIKYSVKKTINVELGNLQQGGLIQVCYYAELLSPPEQLRLFDRYDHLHSKCAREAGSSGLALPLAWELVLLHGGKLTLHQDPTGLTCFNLFLPTV